MANLSCIPKIEKQAYINSWVGKSLKLMLLDVTHVPNAGTDEYVSDVVGHEIIDSNNIYTAGGVVLQGKSAKADPNDPNNIFLDADDVVIGPGATVSYKYGIIYEDMGTGNHSVNPIKAEIDFITEQVIANGVSTIQWAALGIIYIT